MAIDVHFPPHMGEGGPTLTVGEEGKGRGKLPQEGEGEGGLPSQSPHPPGWRGLRPSPHCPSPHRG